MELSTEKRLQLERLLLQREALLARVHTLETRVEEVFGDAWDFDLPDLPSMQKTPKRRATRRSRATKALRAPALEPGEQAYRVCYTQAGVEVVETYADEKALARLLNLPMESVTLKSVETLDASGEVLRTVMTWESDE